MSGITSHVLDTALGRPVVGLRVRLDVLDGDGHSRPVAERITNEQGRITDFVAAGALEARTYRLTFDTGGYFAGSGRAPFYPQVDVVFTVSAADEHHHIPLLLSPFGYSTAGERRRLMLLDEARPHLDALGTANRAFMHTYPGDRAARQPVHTVYGGAQLFSADITARLGAVARATLETYGATPADLARGVGFTADVDGPLAATVHERVRRKLEREPVEDFRIDFEDGFGARPDAEEDATAIAAAREVARGMREGSLPPFLGIRVKSMGEWKARSARTLEIFLDTLLRDAGGQLPANFVVTLPKITVAEQPRTLVRLFEILERRHGLAAGTLRMEVMIEVTQAIIGADGRSPLPGFLAACEGRCVGAHFGTYDYTASCNVTAAFQVMDHPWCDLAKGHMLLAYAGTGIFLSDGSTNVLPVGPHAGTSLTEAEREANRTAVHHAWQLSHGHIRHSLAGGFYQGWDLHPAQIPVRFATCFAFFLEGFAPAADRLRNFIEKAAQATLVGDVFDDAATGQGLLNYFLRALNSGAIDVSDLARTGLTPEEVELRSFAKILASRRARLSAG